MGVDTNTMKEKRRSQRVPAEITVLGEVEDRRLSMCTENVSLEGMFLFSREFVRPRSVFPARVWISNDEEPLQLYLTTHFIERTCMGYGIGASISGISARDSSYWEAFYRSCAAGRADQLRQCIQSERLVRNRRLLVVDNALSPLAIQALRKQGLEVIQTPSVREAVEALGNQRIDVAISDLQRPGMDGMALCCHINRERLPTRTVLLTNSGSPREFLLGMYAGATRVVAKPCSNEVLSARILDLLQQRLPAGRTRLEFSGQSDNTATHSRQFISNHANLLAGLSGGSAVQVARRASQGLGQLCRYVSGRISRRLGA